MSLPATHSAPSSSCCSPKCRRENGSLLAALAGALSLACLVSAVMTDMWTYTEEGILAPGLSRAAKKQNFDGSVLEHSSAPVTGGRHDQQVVRISFTVGLWRVCPSIIDEEITEGTSPTLPCARVGYGHLWNDLNWQQLGLWAPVENTPSFISRMRISTFFAILSVAILIVSTLLAMVGHCAKGQKMLLASGLYALSGLILGCGLIVYVCVLSDEFGPRRPSSGGSASRATEGQSHVSYHTLNNGQNVLVTAQYSYGWSFFLAVLGFLGAEFSAVLCLTAFLNRFETEDEFIKMIPGMTRRMAEHRGGLAELEHHRNSVEAPLLKTGNGNGASFGHHVLTNEDTLYSLEATRGSIVTSQSVNSVIGMSSHNMGIASHLKARNVLEGAEIVPVTADVERRSPMTSTMSRLQHLQQQQQQQHQHQSFLYNNSPTIQSSTTLPRLLSKQQQQQANNHHHHHQYYQQQQQQYQQQQQQRHFVANGLSEDVEMDRTSFMNGDDNDDDDEEQDHSGSHQHHLVKVVVPPPPRLDFVLPEGVPPPPSTTTSSFMSTMPRSAICTTTINGGIISSGSGTCGRKKKSVTIGTFTTVETFSPNPGDESV